MSSMVLEDLAQYWHYDRISSETSNLAHWQRQGRKEITRQEGSRHLVRLCMEARLYSASAVTWVQYVRQLSEAMPFGLCKTAVLY